MRNRFVRRLTPLAVLATLLMANPASAEPAVEVGPAADLVAGGAQVDVSVSVTCEPATPGGTRSLFVQVRQAGGDVVASGGAYTEDLTCNGQSEETTVSVLADAGSRPFHAGDAAVQAALTLCTFAPGVVGEAAPSPADVTPPEAPGPEPSPVPEPPGTTLPGDIVAPCHTVSVSAVVFVHPMESGNHPGNPEDLRSENPNRGPSRAPGSSSG